MVKLGGTVMEISVAYFKVVAWKHLAMHQISNGSRDLNHVRVYCKNSEGRQYSAVCNLLIEHTSNYLPSETSFLSSSLSVFSV
jgi:hypothetical protein